MRYTVVISQKVQKDINRIEKKYYSRIITALAVIATNPFSGKKLEGDYRGNWSFRVWPYRIIYRVKIKEMVVLIVRIGHRQGVYR